MLPCSVLYRLQRYLVNHVRARLEKYEKKDRAAGTPTYLPSEVAILRVRVRVRVRARVRVRVRVRVLGC